MSQRVWLYITTIAVGLWISATGASGLLSDSLAEWPVNVWCWGLFAYVYRVADRRERIEMLTVVALATPMELFFSEVWLIYEYQRDFMPLFVPAGHYFLFDLGRRAAHTMRESMAMPALFRSFPSWPTVHGPAATLRAWSCWCSCSPSRSGGLNLASTPPWRGPPWRWNSGAPTSGIGPGRQTSRGRD